MIKRWWKIFFRIAGIGMLLGILAAGIAVYRAPCLYESRVVLKPGNPPDLQKSIDHLQSADALLRTLGWLELPKRWKVDESVALSKLRESLRVKPSSDERSVTIQVRHWNREDARDIADSLSDEFERYWIAPELAPDKPTGRAHEKEIERQLAELTQSARGIEQGVRVGSSIPTFGPPLSNPAPGPEIATPQVVGSVLDDLTKPSGEKHLKPVPERRDFAMGGDDEAKGRIKAGSLVLEKPVIGQSPVSPDVELNLKLGALAGLLVAFVAALPLTGIGKRIPTPNPPAITSINPEDF